jgi:hypothetical protein
VGQAEVLAAGLRQARLEVGQALLSAAGAGTLTRAFIWAAGCVALAALVCHFLAQRGMPRLRRVLAGLWSVVLLGCVFVAGRVLEFGRVGRWSPEAALGAAALALLIVGLLHASISSWRWLLARSLAGRT